MNWKTEQKKLPQSEEGEMEEKNKHSLRGQWDYKKKSNICVIRIQEGMIKEGRKKYPKKQWLSIALKGFVKLCVCVCVNSQSCSTLWDPMDCSPRSSSIHGILQARILEWVALLQGIFPTQGQNLCLLHCKWIFYHLSNHGSPICEAK